MKDLGLIGARPPRCGIAGDREKVFGSIRNAVQRAAIVALLNLVLRLVSLLQCEIGHQHRERI